LSLISSSFIIADRGVLGKGVRLPHKPFSKLDDWTWMNKPGGLCQDDHIYKFVIDPKSKSASKSKRYGTSISISMPISISISIKAFPCDCPGGYTVGRRGQPARAMG
jgi:hypothetical protein